MFLDKQHDMQNTMSCKNTVVLRKEACLYMVHHLITATIRTSFSEQHMVTLYRGTRLSCIAIGAAGKVCCGTRGSLRVGTTGKPKIFSSSV